MLELDGLNVHYGVLQALHNVSISVDEGELVVIVGSNGAGKSTMLLTISGLLKPTSGTITFLGKRIEKLPTHQIVGSGLTQVPEGRPSFPYLNVMENLLVGAYLPKCRKEKNENLKRVFNTFPVLEERKNQLARTLSGGEQQMLSIARALMSGPKLLMLDEPSLGLAPIIIDKTFDILRKLHDEGVAILLVEQNVLQALKIAERGYVLENGKIALEGKDLSQNEYIRKAYLGIA